jgi:hypothetical protein
LHSVLGMLNIVLLMQIPCTGTIAFTNYHGGPEYAFSQVAPQDEESTPVSLE